MAQELRTFQDIYTAVMEALKIPVSDTTALDRVKRLINVNYITEVAPHKPWTWLRDRADLSIEPALTTGTVSVTAGSTSATLSSAASESKKGYRLKVTGHEEVYEIASHTAGTTTIELTVPYSGATAATATYKIWSNRLAMPSDANQTFDVRHDYSTRPMQGAGYQRFLDLEHLNPVSEEKAKFYHLGDFRDPDAFEAISGLPASATRSSAGLVRTLVFGSSVTAHLEAGDRIEISGAGNTAYNGEFTVSSVSSATITYTATRPLQESSTADTGITVKMLSNQTQAERYRELLIWPSVTTDRYTLHVEYVKEPVPLEDDADEPLIPLRHRSILVQGALMEAYQTLRSDETAAVKAERRWLTKLSRMAGAVNDSTDFPRLRPDPVYLAAKRQRRSTTRYED